MEKKRKAMVCLLLVRVEIEPQAFRLLVGAVALLVEISMVKEHESFWFLVNSRLEGL